MSSNFCDRPHIFSGYAPLRRVLWRGGHWQPSRTSTWYAMYSSVAIKWCLLAPYSLNTELFVYIHCYRRCLPGEATFLSSTWFPCTCSCSCCLAAVTSKSMLHTQPSLPWDLFCRCKFVLVTDNLVRTSNDNDVLDPFCGISARSNQWAHGGHWCLRPGANLHVL